MGWGDSILATGHAKPLYEEGKRIYFTKPDSAHFKHCLKEGYIEWAMGEDVYMNNPYLGTDKTWEGDAKAGFKDCKFVENHFGNRPYVKSGGTSKVIWTPDYKAPVGDIWLTPEEIERGKKDYGEGYVLVEPHTKNTVGGNKAWIWPRWQEVADILLAKGDDVLQNGTPKKRLQNVRYIPMLEYRDALIAVANAKMVITTQGGLHVAAAALGVPAVVIWGEYAHPRNLGYDNHVNLYTGGPDPCGHTVECPGCVQAMRETTVEMVIDGADSLR